MAFKTGGRKCKFESLETRQMMAGDVIGRVHAGTLTLKGDNLSNAITITAGANPNEVLVTGANLAGSATNVNGVSNGAITFVNVTKGLKVKMATGNDRVTINNLTINGKVKLNGGLGLDTFIVNGATFNSSFRLQSGPGADDVTINNTDVAGVATITTGAQFDDVAITASNFGELKVFLNEGNDTVAIANTSVITQTTLSGGEGINTFVDGQSNFFGGYYNKTKLAG